MTISIDAISTKQVLSDVTSTSWTHTPIGTPSLAIVGYSVNSGVAVASYGGNSMTAAAITSPGGAYPEAGIFVYETTNPNPATVALSSFSTGFVIAWCMTIKGHKIGDIFANAVGNHGNGAASSVAVGSGDDQAMVIDHATWYGQYYGITATPTAGQTTIYGPSTPWLVGVGNYEMVVSGTQTNSSSSNYWSAVGIAIKAQPSTLARSVWFFSKMQDFYDELKHGLIPANQFQRRYHEVYI